MFLRGPTTRAQSTVTEMRAAGAGEWRVSTYFALPAAGDRAFVFDVDGNGTQVYGASSTPGTAVLGGPPISVPSVG